MIPLGERVEAVLGCIRPIMQADAVSLDDCLREVEAGLIRWALSVTGGNKSKAAELLGIKRSTLGDRIARCGVTSAPVSPDAAHATVSAAEGAGAPVAARR